MFTYSVLVKIYIYSVLSVNERNKANILSFNFRSKKLKILRSSFNKDVEHLLEIFYQTNKEIKPVSSDNIT